MQITTALLKEKGACADQVALFREHFPKGSNVTLKKCLSVAQLFSWDWAAYNLLSVSAGEAYDEACAPAWKVYNKARATAEARATSLEAYDEAHATAWKACNKARAIAFATAAEKETQ